MSPQSSRFRWDTAGGGQGEEESSTSAPTPPGYYSTVSLLLLSLHRPASRLQQWTPETEMCEAKTNTHRETNIATQVASGIATCTLFAATALSAQEATTTNPTSRAKKPTACCNSASAIWVICGCERQAEGGHRQSRSQKTWGAAASRNHAAQPARVV